jgi:ribosomal protein S20
LAKTPRTWTGARTPSGLKRVRQAERRHAILQPRRTAAKTFVAKALDIATQQTDSDAATTALAEAHAALDRAAKAGAIHPNAAARRKSRLTLKFNAATGGAHVQTATRVTKTTSKAQAAKAAKSRIAAGKADKAKGAQTAAGKARAALSKTARADAAAKAAASAEAVATTAPKAAAKPATKAAAKTTAKAAPKTAAKAKATTAKPKATTAKPKAAPKK